MSASLLDDLEAGDGTGAMQSVRALHRDVLERLGFIRLGPGTYHNPNPDDERQESDHSSNVDDEDDEDVLERFSLEDQMFLRAQFAMTNAIDALNQWHRPEWIPSSAQEFDNAVSASMDEVEVSFTPARPEYVANLPRTILSESISAGPCSICQESMLAGETVVGIGCIHMLHEACAKEWLGIGNTCPVCRMRCKDEQCTGPVPTDTEP